MHRPRGIVGLMGGIVGGTPRPDLGFAGYVRMRLRHIGMSQAQLARNTGISRPALVKLLNGRTRAPRLETTRAMASALGVSPIHLIGLLTGDGYGRAGGHSPELLTGDSAAVSHVTMPNGSWVRPRDRFEKVWDIRNTGMSEWRGHRLRCIDQALSASLDADTQARYFLRPDVADVPVPYTAPGETVRVSIWFTAPSLPVACVSMWRMVNSSGADAQAGLLNVMVLIGEAQR